MSKKINVSFDNIYALDSAMNLDNNFAWHFKDIPFTFIRFSECRKKCAYLFCGQGFGKIIACFLVLVFDIRIFRNGGIQVRFHFAVVFFSLFDEEIKLIFI